MKIKQNPEDFRVEEIYTNIPDGKKYCIFILEKKKWTTLKAIEAIANKMKISVKRFNFAGQKDRQAITKQYVSCADIGKRDIAYLRLKDIKVTFVKYSDKPIMLGGLDGNKFKIVVRDIKEPLQPVRHVPNYYDDQRFGGYRPNLHLVGKEVLKNNYEQAVKLLLLYPFPTETENYTDARVYMEENWGDWVTFDLPKGMINEKKIVGYLEKNPNDFKGALKALPRQLFSMIPQAYQSYLFNKSLSKYLKENYEGEDKEYSLGKLFFCDLPLDLDWPIIGYKTKGNDFDELLKEEGITKEIFNHEIPQLSSEGLTRKAMIKVGIQMGKFKDNKQEVEFSLPPGSYATIVLKGMQNVNTHKHKY